MALLIKNYVIGLILLVKLGATVTGENSFAVKNNEFALNFYEQIIKIQENTGKSIVYSPFSIQTAGALLYGAANGATADELYEGFNLISKDAHNVSKEFKTALDKRENDPSMKILNKIYVRNGETIAPTYKDIVQSDFHSEIENIEFAQKADAAGKMSKWVEDNTSGKIKDFIKSDNIDTDSVMFLLNVVNFKGKWENEFDKTKTSSEDFYLNDGTTKKIDMMANSGSYEMHFINELNAVAVNVPFKDSDLSMFIIRPRQKEDKLDELESKILQTKGGLIDSLFAPRSKRQIVLVLPKFMIEYSINDMRDILEKLNMKSMFKPSAGFSKLLSSNNIGLYISSSIHKAVIEINEEGASAAAATGFGITSRTQPYVFSGDVPFLYFIKGKNGEIYFMGRFTGTN